MAMNPKLLRPRASGFNPKSISGLSAWYDATVASSVTLTNGFVSQWDDLSGNGSNLTQSVEADRPGTSTINGKTAIDFDGSNDYLAVTSNFFCRTMFLVAQRDSATNATNGRIAITALNSSGNAISINIVTDATGDMRVTSQDENSAITGANGAVWAAGQNSIITAIYQGAARYNGTPLSGASTAARSTQQGIVVGARRTTATSSPYDGRIGEIILYSRALSAAEYVRVERYLARKWGVTLA
jgi:hypothetical protein